MIISNVVSKEVLRSIQLKTLEEVMNNLICSFGPMGSNTCIKLKDSLTKYSKDGHTILGNIRYNGIIEQSVVQDLESLTKYITTTVGDGTTSAVVLSTLIFKEINEQSKEGGNLYGKIPFQIIEDFKYAVSKIKEEILLNKKQTTVDDIYKIALISTNNNKEVAENIKSIYNDYGMDVFIDVAISNSIDNTIKIYDGMTLDAGYADTCYINNPKKATSEIRNPFIYAFEDPIDTPEMIGLLDSIIEKNILIPYNNEQYDQVKPTVIIAPKVSRDLSIYMDKIAEFMYSIEEAKVRPPFLLITNVFQQERFMDIAKLCKAPFIKKYIDPKIQETDIKKGLAPTPANIETFYGTCDEIVSDATTTKFINPKDMRKKDGSYTTTFNTLVEYLTAELNKAKADGEDANVTGTLKRRINSLKSNMVEYLVGGVSISDRDSLRDLVEDAVKNCRSAADNGVGFGANFEGCLASNKLANDNYMISIISKCYRQLLLALYKTCFPEINANNYIIASYTLECPINLRTGEFDNNVLSSIESDIVVLETISKIITIMLTCNQFTVPDPAFNVYMATENI